MQTLRRGTVACAAALVLLLAGCTPTPEQPAPTQAPTPSASAVEPQAPPELVLDGTADENRPYFDHVVAKHIVDGGDMARASVIDLLISAGWSPEQIEATPDATPLGNATDAVSFSVRMGDACLLGQWNGEYTSAVMPAVQGSRCLIGATYSVE